VFVSFLLGFGLLIHLRDVVATPIDFEQLCWYGVALTSLFLFARLKWPASQVLTTIGWPLAAFVALAGLSALWSASPGTTITDAVILGASVFIGMFAAASLTPLELVRTIRAAATLVALLSFVAIVSRVPWALGEDGSAIGLLAHRNSLGAVAGLALLLWVVGPRTAAVRVLLALALLTTVLVVSDSRTAQVAVLLALGALACDRSFEANPGLGVSAGSMFAAVCTIGYIRLGGLEALLIGAGKSSSLTGRTDFWVVLVEVGRQRPWVGQGWGAAWLEGSPSLQAMDERFPGIVSSHNVLLESFLALGLVGVGLLLLVILRGVRVVASRGGVAPVLRRPALGLIVFICARGVTEAGFPAKNSGFTMAFVALIGAVHLQRQSRSADEAMPDG